MKRQDFIQAMEEARGLNNSRGGGGGGGGREARWEAKR